MKASGDSLLWAARDGINLFLCSSERVTEKVPAPFQYTNTHAVPWKYDSHIVTHGTSSATPEAEVPVQSFRWSASETKVPLPRAQWWAGTGSSKTGGRKIRMIERPTATWVRRLSEPNTWIKVYCRALMLHCYSEALTASRDSRRSSLRYSYSVLESMASECSNPSVKEGNFYLLTWISKELQMNLTLSIPIESTSEIHFEKNPLSSYLGTELLKEVNQCETWASGIDWLFIFLAQLN